MTESFIGVLLFSMQGVSSCKLQAASYKLQATSYKLQATSYKLQATSYKFSYSFLEA
jgi:hypothetical protein